MGMTTKISPARSVSGYRPSEVIAIRGLSRRFGSVQALDDVSLTVARGEIHAFLGPNGAGKSTLVRVLAGLVDPDEGSVRMLGDELADLPVRRARESVGLVPSGDRSFYLRISGLENLAFFARLHGLRKGEARRRAWECLREVGLEEAAVTPVGVYSHGMQKRLSVARALLMAPPILLVDEATHDLDPEAARNVRSLVSERATQGAAVIWATQRIDEIRGFADRVTLIDLGRVRFDGTVPQFMAVSVARRHLLRLRARDATDADVLASASTALRPFGEIARSDDTDGEHFVVSLREGVILGEAVSALTAVGVDVLSCREERSGIEEAFLALTRREDP
jgi:ABC-type multidrug transport system ATPase subunit